MSRRFYHAIDKNQKEIIAVLKKAGASVLPIGSGPNGCPDFILGWLGKNILVEVKNPKGKNKILDSQIRFESAWRGGKIHVVRTVDEALQLLTWENVTER